MTFKKFSEFLTESLAFLTLDKTMKNEFMNNMQLKNDFENAKRQFYVNGGCLLTHIAGEEFELRTFINMTSEELDGLINSHINASTEKLKFRRVNKPTTDILKEKIWLIKAKIE